MKNLRLFVCFSLLLLGLAACASHKQANYDTPAAYDPDICVGENCSCEAY